MLLHALKLQACHHIILHIHLRLNTAAMINKFTKSIAFQMKSMLLLISMMLTIQVVYANAAGNLRDITVKGKVSTADGPLAGVTVKVDGSATAVTTDADGNFTITVPENAFLVFSHTGYKQQRIAVKNQAVINVTLVTDTKQLDEIVVTGYRAQPRGTIVGSVSSVNSAEFADLPVDNLSNALAGRLSGATITQNAGTPGRESSIRIRAIGTTNNSEPLYVIDGVVSDKFAFDGLSPNEVDNITLLKDGASAAIYGSRAANGVVLITTKRGRSGASKISYNGTYGVQTPTKIPSGLTAFEHATLINDILQYTNIPTTDARYYSADELEYFKNNSWSWIDYLWKDPVTTQHAMNVSGGNNTIKYFMGGSYNYATGSFDNLDFKKMNLRGNMDVNVTKNLTVSMDLSTDNRSTDGPSWGGDDWGHEDLYKALALRSAMVPPYVKGLPTGNYVEWHPGAVISGMAGYQDKTWTGFEARVSMNYKMPFIKGLSAKLMYNRYNRQEAVKQMNLSYDMAQFNQTGANSHIVGEVYEKPKARVQEKFIRQRSNNIKRYQFNAQLNYQRTFGNHGLDALLVYEQSEASEVWFEARRDSLISPAIDQFTGGRPSLSRTNGAEFEGARISYVGLASYNFRQTYLLEASFRYDGSSIFAPETRWGFFPSVSAGWRISNEPFFKVGFINDLKLRAAFGRVGNDAIDPFQYLSLYNIQSEAAIFTSPSFGLVPGVLANPSITWEKANSYNAGLDGRFLNNRINLKLDVFFRKTYDILGTRQLSIPSTFGARMPDENYQQINTRGIEIELGYTNEFGDGRGKGSYYVRGNFGYATSRFVVVDQAQNIRAYQSAIGRSVGLQANGSINRAGSYLSDILFGYVATDIIRTQKDLDALPAGYTILGEAPILGMLNYKDIRGPGSDQPDGRITSDDQEYLGKYSIPPMNYGLSVGAAWKSFSIDVLFQGLAGHKVMLHANARRVQGRVEETSYGFWNDRWTPTNTDAAYPAARRYGFPGTDYPASTWFLRDASFLRLKSVNLSYSLPENFLNRIHVDNIRLFFTGTNLFLLKEKIGDFNYDPEANNIRSYPLMKTISFGLNITL
jgi:TonB-linked SusC/RagA family outer membrane protein